MKHFVVSLACLAACLALCSSAVAATLQWSYSLGVNGFCYQTVADGNGGCAVIVVDAGAFKVIWFDNKGAVRYSKSGITGTVPVISSCEKNALVFCHNNGATIQTVLVDKNASEHITTAANTHYLTYAGVAFTVKPQRLSDRKGYFVEKVDLPANTVTLERYAYK